MAKAIGLWGWGGVGKDQCADFLFEEGWDRRAFADPLRELAALADPIVGTRDGELRTYTEYLDFYGYNEAKNHDDFRPFLQRLGDGARRVFGPSFWVDQAVANLSTDTVFTDVRYEGEGDAIKKIGGIVVAIYRPGFGPANSFEAEVHGMQDYDFDGEIHNDGSLDDLGEAIRGFADLA